MILALKDLELLKGSGSVPLELDVHLTIL